MHPQYFLIYILLFSLFNYVYSFEIISTTILGVSIATRFAIDMTYCKFKECCTSREIPADFDKLEELLEEKIYGQHLVKQVVTNSLKAHWRSPHMKKALTLSFHGWPGGGKNYVTKFVQESIYARGSQSDHVHHFIGRIHFPSADKIEEYKENLYSWIKGNVTRCARQLFIFDEVDKMPSTLLNTIKPMIDYNENVEKLDYRQSVFMFLSNTGSSLITDQYLKLWRNGVKREEIQLKDFEKLITQGAFNEEGGFHHSDTIKSNLIDHYIPFLPMEYEHVRLCIIDEFKARNITEPTEDDINEILDYVEWGPKPENLFSTTGCKRLSQKVGYVAQKNYY